MSEIRFTQDHEYVRVDGDVGTVGVTDFAQGQLGDIVFVELPVIGKRIEKGKEFAVVESVKAASDVLSPVSGEVIEVNEALQNTAALVNEDAQGKGWIAKIRLADAKELDTLMDEAAYAAFAVA
jgi:glycine cleavage system H protein